jgi:amino acid adenylation domain-containing protein
MPEDNILKERIKKLTPEQIRKLMAKSGKSARDVFSGMPRNEAQVYPLSKVQERFWFLSKLYPNTALYNIPLAVRLQSASIDPIRLAEVINRIVRENDILRTTFEERDKQVNQRIHPELKIQLEYEDISGTTHSRDLEEIIADIGADHGSTLFNLSELPLLSVKLLKTSKKDSVLFFNLHHLISDGWTNSLLARDLALLYSGAGENPSGRNKYQYIDYVKWEQEWLQSSRYQKQLDFWKKEMAELPDPFHFQRDFQDEGPSFEGGSESCTIHVSLHEKVATYCQGNDITPYQFYISCYALLLARYSGMRDLIIGTPVANRNQRHFQNTYGVFINSLPIRFRIDTSLNFKKAVEGYRELINECMNNQEVPFGEIINAVNPHRNLHENPLYNVHFAYQHFPQKSKADEHALLPIDYRLSKFDINFWVLIAGDERTLSISYKSKLIRREKIKRFLDHFLSLVESVIVHPDVPIQELDFISSKHLSLLTGNSTQTMETSWLALFEKSVRQFPEETAVVDEQGTMTYRSLNQHSSELALALTTHKVAKGDVVIIRTERNRNHVISILACMKCGAAYLPLDNRIPPERFAFILGDSKARIVLTEAEIDNVNCLGFNTIRQNQSADTVFDNAPLQGEDIVYIIYTSGSTGKPKGVCVPHRAVINYTHAMQQKIADPGVCSFAHVSAFDADLGNTAIFMTLGFGGTLMIPAAETLIDPVLLTKFLSTNPVDAIKIVPAHLNALRDYLPGILPRKLLICAGERLNKQLVVDIQDVNPLLRIMNHYGPAETTISSLTFDVPTEMNNHVLPIGSPIDNTCVLLLDQDKKLLPKGTPGEICIAGINVALKYLNQPELTKERFIQHPLSPWPVYKTGDIGYLNEEDQIVFLDRIDRQIKVNGFRIELGEIEAVLKAHECVANAFVFTDGENEKTKLHAAVVFHDHGTTRQLQTHLANYSPQHLFPIIFVLNTIPVTRNGKVDLEQLKRMCTANPVASRKTAQPRDLVEIKLIEIFMSVLNVTNVDPGDQFFDLGGHSLLAISLISQINTAFHAQFPLAILFQYGSVQELASQIRMKKPAFSDDSSPYVTLVNKGHGQRIIWLHPAGGNVMSYYSIAKTLANTYDSKAFTATDHHLKDTLSINGLASDYVTILKDMNELAGSILAGWSMGALIAHDMAILRAKEGNLLPLVLIDQPVPHHNAHTHDSYDERVRGYIERIEVFTGETILTSALQEARVDYTALHGQFVRLRLMPEEVSMDSFRSFLDVLVKHNNIISDFYPSVYHGPVLLLKASEKIMLKTSKPQPEYFLEDLGWREFCTNLTVLEVPGNHITMLTEKHTTQVGVLIQAWLSKL